MSERRTWPKWIEEELHWILYRDCGDSTNRLLHNSRAIRMLAWIQKITILSVILHPRKFRDRYRSNILYALKADREKGDLYTHRYKLENDLRDANGEVKRLTEALEEFVKHGNYRYGRIGGSGYIQSHWGISRGEEYPKVYLYLQGRPKEEPKERDR